MNQNQAPSLEITHSLTILRDTIVDDSWQCVLCEIDRLDTPHTTAGLISQLRVQSCQPINRYQSDSGPGENGDGSSVQRCMVQ
eukprot:m.56154 g.56154  ORF g.56154 m.56154 type:complete len:83 (+) comp16944_c0_seq1:4331-4579(+)